MLFQLHATAKDFSQAVGSTIGRHEIQNNLFYKNITMGMEKEDNSNMVMASVRDDCGVIRICAIRTIPHPFVIYERDNLPCNEALECLANGLCENHIDIDLMMCEPSLAERFCRLYCEKLNRQAAITQSMTLYLLEKPNSLPLPSGTFRYANQSDMYYLPYWSADFAPACNIGDYNLESGIHHAQYLIDSHTGYIWDDGTPVSLAAQVRRTSDCAFIGYVYTPPYLRGKGYATGVVLSLSKKLLADGYKYCALYADCANPLSNKVYRNIGYQDIFRYDQYRIN